MDNIKDTVTATVDDLARMILEAPKGTASMIWVAAKAYCNGLTDGGLIRQQDKQDAPTPPAA